MLILGAGEYAARAGLFAEANKRTILQAVRRRVYIAQALYLAAMLLCVFDTRLSIGVIVLIQLNYAIAPRVAFLRRLYRLNAEARSIECPRDGGRGAAPGRSVGE